MHTFLSIVLALLITGADQGIKHFVRQFPRDGFLFSLGPLFSCWRTTNTGIAFSLLSRFPALILVLSAAFTAWFVYYLCTRKSRIEQLVCAVILGGTLGNLIDRVFQGYVVDFIDVRIINFAIFNFADICAVCGGIYFGIMLAVDEIKEDKEKKAAKNSEVTALSENVGQADDLNKDEQA